MERLLEILLPKAEKNKKYIWENCLFIFDTNVFLNLYKYSNSTRNEFSKILDKVKDRVWIPHQVALEYLYNRQTKIHEQKENYMDHLHAIDNACATAKKEITLKLGSIKKSFRKFDVDDLTKKIDDFFYQLKKEVEDKNKDNPDFHKDDVVLSLFLKYFNNNIGEANQNDDLTKIYEEGQKRYENEIPPGYKDLEKKKGKTRLYGDIEIKSEYGDLLIWKQIINKSRESGFSVVFITDDSKEDWWKNEKGIKIPRNELLNEFTFCTNNDFLMYNSESFLNDSKEFLKIDVEESAITEVRNFINLSMLLEDEEIKKQIKETLFEEFNKREILNQRIHDKESLYKELNVINEIIFDTKRMLNKLKTEKDLLEGLIGNNADNASVEYDLAKKQLEEIVAEINEKEKIIKRLIQRRSKITMKLYRENKFHEEDEGKTNM